MCHETLNNPATRLLVAQADRESIQTAIDRVEAIGLWKLQANGCARGSRRYYLNVRRSGSSEYTRLEWDENIGFIVQPTKATKDHQDYWKFVSAWIQAKAVFQSIPVASGRDLLECLDSDKQYRGYDPAKPGETKWLY